MSNYKTIQELADQTGASSRGTAYDGYNLEPVQWLKEINDAAKKQLYFTEMISQHDMPSGTKDMIVPFRSKYLKTLRAGSTGTVGDWDVKVTNDGAALSTTALTNLDGVVITPLDRTAFVSIPYKVLRSNAVDFLDAARTELTYHAGDEVDQEVAFQVRSAGASDGTTTGSQRIYGGDAGTDNALTAGDVLTTDMIADAKKRMQSQKVRYWNGGVDTASTAQKPPWMAESNSPIALFIAAEQENPLLKASQFVNAAEYGSSEIVQNGEIGKYLGIKVVTTANTPQVAASGTAFDGGSAPGVDITRCIMMKGRAAAAIAWSQRPRLTVSNYPRESSMDVIMEQDYAVKTIHDDAIVFLDVADE